MHRSFFAVKDTFINSGSRESNGETFRDKNVGQDEVLELKKVFRNREFHAPTRMLIQFDTDDVKNYITSSNVPGNYKLFLRLYETAGTSGLSNDYTIAAYPLSESWDEGVGKEADNPKTTVGCSWVNRQNRGGGISEVSWSNAGGTYISEDEVTQSFSLSKPDIEMDVTSLAKKWLSGENKNHGFLLRFSGSSEVGNIVSTSIDLTTESTTSSSIQDTISSSLETRLHTNLTTSSSIVTSSISGSAAGDGSLLSHVVTVQSIGQFNGYGSSNKYLINGEVTASVNLLSGNVYRFYQQDNSNNNHPIRLSTTYQQDGVSANEYTTDVTYVGTAGNTGAYLQISASDSTPTLYYYCAVHQGMGGSGKLVNGVEQSRVTTAIDGQVVSATFSSSISSSISSSLVSLNNVVQSTSSSISESIVETTVSTQTQTGEAEDLKFFSRQTNTIYSPKLELRWDDHLPATGSNTGSLTPLDLSGNTENYVYQLHKKEAYNENETVKFRFGARERYTDKSFTTSIQTVSGSYFAEGSASYAIVDLATNEDVIPFSSYTTMSCDTISPYFKQDLNTFEPNRAYKILLKVEHGDGQSIIFDDDFEFILRS